MGDIFLKLFNMSFAASWLIGAVIVVRLIAGKMPRRMICLLWGLVAIRLACPFSMESALSFVPSDEVIPESILSASHRVLNVTTGVEWVDAKVNGRLGDIYHEGTTVPFDYGNTLMANLGVIWACGAFGLLLYAALVSLRLRKYLKEAVLLRDRVYLCDYAQSSFVFGLFRPCIYMPSETEDTDREYAIAHEEAHIRRRDHVWKMRAFFLLTVYWFNPLSWAAFLLFCRDMELACDERVIRNLSTAERKAYARSLVACSFRKKIAIVYPMAFGEVGVKQRVKSILNYKKPTVAAVLLSFAALIAIGICFLTTSPRRAEIGGIVTNRDSAERQIHMKEIELSKMLLDYDKGNIVEALVLLQNFDNADTDNAYADNAYGDSANADSAAAARIFLVLSKEKIMNAQEEDKIKALVSEYLNLDIHNIYLEYRDSEAYASLFK